MTQLERYQRGLLDLIKRRGTPPCDPYLRSVAGSCGLEMVREIALWWRALQLEAQCHFTCRLLKRLNCFDALVRAYFEGNPTSPFVEEQSRDFLAWLGTHSDDPLIRTTAEFEHALLEVAAGSVEIYEVLWDRHPERVLAALENGAEIPLAEPNCLYRIQIGAQVADTVACTREVRE